ncbi:MAG: PIN domain-containing protein [Gemmatimonadota bacterium]
MRILFDTNVVLDVLLDRTPHAEFAALLFAEVETRQLVGLLCGTTITTVHYIAQRTLGEAGARTQIERLLGLFEVASVTRPVLEGALSAGIKDFEDAVVHESARLAGSDGIVTRNTIDFKAASLKIYSPGELVSALRALRQQEGRTDAQVDEEV